jgi:hypothetical protein
MGAAILAARRRGGHARGVALDGSLLPLALLLGLATVLVARPFEYLLGGRDPGVYINAGVLIARAGGVLVEDGVSAGVPASAVASLFEPWWPEGQQRLQGFQFVGGGHEEYVPQFLHLFPAWVALLYSLGGIGLAPWATPLFGVLGVAAVYIAGRLIFGSPAALIGAVLLAGNVAQVWFSRYPSTETASQFQLFSGLAFFALFVRTRSRYWGVMAAVALGQLYLTRIDMLLVPVALFGFLTWEWLGGRLDRAYVPFAAVHLSLLAQALVHIAVYAMPYAQNSYGHTLASIQPALLGGFALLAGGIVGVKSSGLAGRLVIGASGRRLRQLIALGAVGLALYAYFVRPGWQLPEMVTSAGTTGGYDEDTLVRIGWYVTPIGVALGVAGYALGLHRQLARQTALFFLVGGAFTVFYGIRPSVMPDHFWAIRRFLPVTIPCLLLCGGYLAVELWRARSWRPIGAAVATAGVGIVVVNSILTLAPVWPHVELAGVRDQLARLNAALPEDAVVLIEDPAVGNAVSVPLLGIFARDVFVIQPSSADQAGLRTAIERWWDEGRPVLLLSSGTTMSLAPDGYAFRFLGAQRLDFPQFERTLNRLPRAAVRSLLPIELYQVERTSRTSTAVSRVDVGEGDYAFLRQGFYAPERTNDGVTFRWTADVAHIRLPAQGGTVRIAVRMGAPRPPGAAPVRVRVFADDRELADLEVGPQLAVHELAVPADHAGPQTGIALAIVSDAWQPSLHGGDDARLLGVVVDWIEARPAP